MLIMLKFNSPLEQVCYIALPKDKGEQAIIDYNVLIDKVVHEYKANLQPKENDIILEVVVDLSTMFDLTNMNDFNNVKNKDFMQYMKSNNKKLIRYVELELQTPVIYKVYHIKYRILDCSVIKKISKI